MSNSNRVHSREKHGYNLNRFLKSVMSYLLSYRRSLTKHQYLDLLHDLSADVTRYIHNPHTHHL
ncbi:hypothetical protein BDW02DRAFT_568235 [Decorospora gaudefroyi]|uniref:Uncharacterized protein n=1 Tax=Decorospora gaudefroyi TaxID=184978 RepID=A0A6A5KI49_9PLEO|nr:hypothetical protein BDW02DRAFT_568235 [Decorospora gaudefroyi]